MFIYRIFKHIVRSVDTNQCSKHPLMLLPCPACNPDLLHPCSCCGQKTIRNPGNWECCPVCQWDGIELGIIHIEQDLQEAQNDFKKYGVGHGTNWRGGAMTMEEFLDTLRKGEYYFERETSCHV